MVSGDVVFWEVDTQVDFMLPGGKLYVPGAEKLIPNFKKLMKQVRAGRVFLVSDACVHSPDDEEFRHWPPHCLRGTHGAEIIPEALAKNHLVIPNDPGFKLPRDLSKFQQVVLEKQTLDVFDNPHTQEVLKRSGREPEYCVFGVVTEYCVRRAALGLLKRGYRTAVITDAIETLKPEDRDHTLAEFRAHDARFITTDQAVAMIGRPAASSKMPTPAP